MHDDMRRIRLRFIREIRIEISSCFEMHSVYTIRSTIRLLLGCTYTGESVRFASLALLATDEALSYSQIESCSYSPIR